jgi:hypothetical protein
MKNYWIFLICFIANGIFTLSAQIPAFPGAEGFGKYATGGRDGDIYIVTNLNDSGPGSFREAVSSPGRIVVFHTGGVIRLEDRVKVAPDITIAGQTAPGDGITIYGHGLSFSSNTIVRHLRLHGSIGMSRGSCTLVADNLEDAIFDHVSVQWGRWDNLHVKNTRRITLQYCIIGEAIDPQRFGALLERPDSMSIHHCLWINNQSRNPKAKAGIQFYNNIIYNWGSSGFIGGHSAADHYQDIVNNYFIAGPSSSTKFLDMFSETDHVYHSGNYLDMNKDGIFDGRPITNEDFIDQKATLMQNLNHGDQYLLPLEAATDAYTTVMKEAGANLKRDVVDNRLISHMKSLGTLGEIIREESAVNGQPEMDPGKAPVDSDHDGIPDEWESAFGLNPNDASDAILYTLDKHYSTIEVYLNQVAEKISAKEHSINN